LAGYEIRQPGAVSTVLLATTVHLTRYLMAQHPVAAEYGAATTDLLAEVSRGPGIRRIIEIASPDDASDESKYLVIDGSEVRTTTQPPPWQNEVESERILLPAQRTTLLTEMRRRHAEFADRQALSAFPVALDTLESYYDERPRLNGEPFRFLPLDEVRLAEVLASPSATHRWCEETIKDVRRTHLSFQAAGAEAAAVLAVLSILLVSTDADKLLALGTAGAIRSDDATTATLLREPTAALSILKVIAGESPLRITPVAQPLYYLSRFGSHDVDIFDCALVAARKLIGLGDDDRDNLKDSHAIEIHYVGLYGALCWYLAADQVLGAMETIFVDAAPHDPRLRYISDERVICEERRAVLITALNAAAGLNPRIPDLWDGTQLWGFLHGLRAVSASEARTQLRDYALKLLLPRFLRELATGWLEVASAETIDEGLGRLSRLAAELEEALPETIGYRFEPNYLQVTYDCLIDGLGRAGRRAERARVQRLRDELPARVAALINAARTDPGLASTRAGGATSHPI
jgi:hypothetical protein